MTCSNTKKLLSSYSSYGLIIALAILQAAFWSGFDIPYNSERTISWQGSRSIKPDLEIVPPVPNEATVQATSFGDEQFFFRGAAFDIQNAGDTFGRSTSLIKYDYAELYKWWVLLDSLDAVSDYIPSLAGYYFGAVPDSKKISYVIDYLERHADRNPSKKWWWYAQAVYHAKFKLKDFDRALAIAEKLFALPEDVQMPLWTRQYKAFIHEGKGEYKEACQIILNILDTYKDLKPGEINFMIYFIKERINAMAAIKDDPSVDLDPRCRALYEEMKEVK